MQKYTGVVIDAKGAPMTGVTVTVNVAGGSAATIYSDNGVTAKANPFTNDANGSFEFYAANGRYDIVLAKTGVTFVAADTTDIALFDGFATGPNWHVNRSTSQSIAHNTTTKVQFDSEEFDSHAAYDNVTNFRFTVPSGQGGKYLVGAVITLANISDAAIFRVGLYKNGVEIKRLQDVTGSTSYNPAIGGSVLLSLIAADYLEIFVFHNTGIAQNVGGSPITSYFWGARIF